MNRRTFAVAVLIASALSTFPHSVVEAGQKDIEARLACQCGCGLTVLTCNHLQCGFAVPAREKIASALDAGLSDDEVVRKFAEEYGEKVLSSPTHSGFNLLAWYMPYVAVFVGGALVFLVMRKWRKPAVETAPSSEQEAKPARAGRDQLERELKDLDS